MSERKFKVGDPVWFHNPDGKRFKGQIDKVDHKLPHLSPALYRITGPDFAGKAIRFGYEIEPRDADAVTG